MSNASQIYNKIKSIDHFNDATGIQPGHSTTELHQGGLYDDKNYQHLLTHKLIQSQRETGCYLTAQTFTVIK